MHPDILLAYAFDGSNPSPTTTLFLPSEQRKTPDFEAFSCP
jgi:hypothetical protein